MKIEIGLKGYFTNAAGRRQRAEVAHVWSDSCVNLRCEDGSLPTSVLIKQPGCIGWYFEPDQVDAIEAEIQAKGLIAARVTPADVEANIASEHYFTAAAAVGLPPVEGVDFIPPRGAGPLDLLTFCVLVLKNGFTVTGESACASPENFDADLGRKIARANAVSKVWSLMGYELRSRLAHAASQRASITVTDELVSRFLTWSVPASVCPDGAPGSADRTGTNLLSAAEARQMLEHVLATPLTHKG